MLLATQLVWLICHDCSPRGRQEFAAQCSDKGQGASDWAARNKVSVLSRPLQDEEAVYFDDNDDTPKPLCLPWCEETPCTELTGNPHFECAACVSGLCRSGTTGFLRHDVVELNFHAAPPLALASEDDINFCTSSCCVGSEEEAAIASGFFVIRDAVPGKELYQMLARWQSIPLPQRLVCGAPGFQKPPMCTISQGELRESFPETIATVDRAFGRMSRREDSGFGANYSIDAAIGDYVTVKKWPLAQNVSCVFGRIFDAAVEFMPPISGSCSCPSVEQLLADESGLSLTECWLHCMLDAVTRLPAERALQALHAKECRQGYVFLRGPVLNTMGWHNRWGMILARVAALTNVSVWTGFHDWHRDGPTVRPTPDAVETTRAHKAFIMVYKSEGNARLTNLLVASNAHKIRDGDSFNPKWLQKPRGLKSAFENMNALQKRAWYIRDDWDDIEHAACNPLLEAGDILIARQDVWHRTQDFLQDRLLLKFEIPRPILSTDTDILSSQSAIWRAGKA